MTDDEKKFSQADVDRIIQTRLDREKAKYDEVVNENTALKAKVGEYEKTSLDTLKQKIASEKKLPAALIKRLQGNTEAELQADADSLLKEIGAKEGDGTGGNPDSKNEKPLTKEAIKAMSPEEIQANLPKIKEQMKAGTLK